MIWPLQLVDRFNYIIYFIQIYTKIFKNSVQLVQPVWYDQQSIQFNLIELQFNAVIKPYHWPVLDLTNQTGQYSPIFYYFFRSKIVNMLLWYGPEHLWLIVCLLNIILFVVLTLIFARVTGATMEVNISHRCRQEILSSPDLAHPNVFKNAVNELMQLMKMVGL